MVDIASIINYLINNYGLLGVFLASLIGNSTIFLPVPTYLLVYALGAKMNPFLLGLVAGTGAALGELTSYMVGFGIEAGTHVEKRKFKKRYKDISKLFSKYGFWIIPLFAATPLPMDAVGLVAGFLKYSWRKFLLGCLIGKLIMHWVIAYAGFKSYEFVMQIFGENQSYIWVTFGLIVLALFLAWLFYASRTLKNNT